MKIYVDADGCPVVRLTIKIASEYNIPIVVVADTAHYFDIDNELATTLIVSKGADSSDFAILSRCGKGDIIVTQDYALAAMCLAKGAYPINQNGMLYTDENIDGMLLQRHIGRQIRAAGGKTHHIKKRVKAQDDEFEKSFRSLVKKLLLTNS
jgi:uncharacterized protein YaiI (UPF0178 family)